MFKLSACLALFAAMVTPAFWAQSKTSVSSLPPGPMQAKASTGCMECHDARIIEQQRMSKPAWTKEVDKMVKWGALVDPKDHDALVDYLSENFGTDKAPYVATRLQTTKTSK